ncbi:hypothetical protein ACHAWF_010360 [Thalassiosira exigua]
MQAPSVQHYWSAIHALKDAYLTAEYGISFHSNVPTTVHAFNHFPSHHDKEAYTDATPPSPSECQRLTAFSNACWGGQFGNTIPDGTPVELFQFRSLSGYLICRCGGPIAWRSIRQHQTALSSCEVEILATNECIVDLLLIHHRMADLGMPDAATTTSVYNDNHGSVDWYKNVTNKGIKHFNLMENKKQEDHASGDAVVTHILGEINSSDIFKKEMKDAAHFHRLRVSFVVSRANFFRLSHNVPSEVGFKTPPFYSPSYVSDDDDSAAAIDEVRDVVDDASDAALCDQNSAPSGRDLPLAAARRSPLSDRHPAITRLDLRYRQSGHHPVEDPVRLWPTCPSGLSTLLPAEFQPGGCWRGLVHILPRGTFWGDGQTVQTVFPALSSSFLIISKTPFN